MVGYIECTGSKWTFGLLSWDICDAWCPCPNFSRYQLLVSQFSRKKKALVSRMLKVFEYQANDNNHGTEIWRKFPLDTPEYSAQVISLPVSLSFRC